MRVVMQARSERKASAGRAATMTRGAASFQFRSSKLVAGVIQTLLPTRMQATVKNLISPTTRLDPGVPTRDGEPAKRRGGLGPAARRRRPRRGSRWRR